jgi:hypothetical protein
MWHPHLKRNWINEKDFHIVPTKSGGFPVFLQVNKENSFLTNDSNAKQKMQCSCKFVKLDDPISEPKTGIGKYKKRLKVNEIDQNSKLSLPNEFNNRKLEKDKLERRIKFPSIRNSDNENFDKLRMKQTEDNNSSNERTNIDDITNEPYRKKWPFTDSNFSNLSSTSEFSNNGNKLSNSEYPSGPEYENSFKKFESYENLSENINNNQDVKSLLNYLRMNSLILKNIENMLLNSRSKQIHNDYYTNFPISENSFPNSYLPTMTPENNNRGQNNFISPQLFNGFQYPVERKSQNSDLLQLAAKLLGNR